MLWEEQFYIREIKLKCLHVAGRGQEKVDAPNIYIIIQNNLFSLSTKILLCFKRQGYPHTY
jgi:hypothetical protein